MQHTVSMMKLYEQMFVGGGDLGAQWKQFLELEQLLRERMMVDRPRSWAYDPVGPYAEMVTVFRLTGERDSRGGRPGADEAGPSTRTRRRQDDKDRRTGTPRSTGNETPAPDTFDSYSDMVKVFGSLKSRRGHEYCMRYNFGGDSSCTHPLADDGSCLPPGLGGKKRLHKCCRCGGEHGIEGKGKCSDSKKIR